MSRFEEATNDVYLLLEEVINTEHRHIIGAGICIMFDVKKRKSGGRFVLGRIKSTNEELKAFATDENGNPYDYIMYLDKEVWLRIDDEDKKRLLYHELCHCLIDPEANTNQYKIQPHEIETFYSEMERNSGDLRWGERLALIAASVHDPENNDGPPEVE